MIQLFGIEKSYPAGEDAFFALKGIDLIITRADFVAVMGPSGSGKSTLLNILGLLDFPTGGRYLLEGADVSALRKKEQALLRSRKIGFVFQSFNLLARTSVEENVELPLLYTALSRQERAHRVDWALQLMGMQDKRRNWPSQLSGGQQQRVAIARALVNHPSIILADEPTGNLDSKTSAEIMNFLQKLNEERAITVVLVTHEHDIAAYSKRWIVLSDGLIVEQFSRNGSSEAAP
ncbi:MAG: ABC transporter ATP-binding protein [Acidobacteria bacterium]|nr:ABC transporter ATP-binding protein [Acidobacteriota bacterium]